MARKQRQIVAFSVMSVLFLAGVSMLAWAEPWDKGSQNDRGEEELFHESQASRALHSEAACVACDGPMTINTSSGYVIANGTSGSQFYSLSVSRNAASGSNPNLYTQTASTGTLRLAGDSNGNGNVEIHGNSTFNVNADMNVNGTVLSDMDINGDVTADGTIVSYSYKPERPTANGPGVYARTGGLLYIGGSSTGTGTVKVGQDLAVTGGIETGAAFVGAQGATSEHFFMQFKKITATLRGPIATIKTGVHGIIGLTGSVSRIVNGKKISMAITATDPAAVSFDEEGTLSINAEKYGVGSTFTGVLFYGETKRLPTVQPGIEKETPKKLRRAR